MITGQPISVFELVSIVTSLAALVAVAVSLYYQRGQTKEMSRSLKGSTFTALAEQMLSTDALFIEHPELRPYFYAGVDIQESDPNYHQVGAVSELLLDFFGVVLLQSDQFPQAWSKNWWPNYIRDMFATSPALRAYLDNAQEWYKPELVTLRYEAEAKLKASLGTQK